MLLFSFPWPPSWRWSLGLIRFHVGHSLDGLLCLLECPEMLRHVLSEKPYVVEARLPFGLPFLLKGADNAPSPVVEGPCIGPGLNPFGLHGFNDTT